MRGKTYKAIKEKAPKEAVAVTEAVAFIKENARKSFDETVEVHVRLGIDPEKSDQMVRGSVDLPGGAAKAKRIAVITSDETEQKAAQDAGAQVVGGKELIDKIAKEGKIDADIVVATPDMMPEIAKVARVLGPQGLMPNPKTGTVSPKPGSVVKELLAGKLSFKMDQLGNIHEAVAKTSWEAPKIEQNVTALLGAIRAVRPTTMKGKLIMGVSLKSTMGPAVKVSFSD